MNPRDTVADFAERQRRGRRADPAPFPEDFAKHFVELPDVIRLNIPRKTIPTGLTGLDGVTGGGLAPGDAVIFGSGPGGLKTTIETNMIATMAGPLTAICVIAWDERWTKVAQKTGSLFGERYAELDAAHPDAIEGLASRIRQRDGFVRFVDPASALPIEHIAEGFTRLMPPGRVPIYFVDLLQLMESLTLADSDPETVELKKIVEALLRVGRVQGAIVVAASETTKATISLEAVEASPLSIFAGTRKIASRFDVPVAMAKIDDLTVKAFIRKNRLGSTTEFLIRLDPLTWRVACVSDGQAQAEEDAALIKRRKTLAKEILDILAGETRPISHNRVAASLKAAEVRFTRADVPVAIALLVRMGYVVENDGPRESRPVCLARAVDVAKVVAEW